MGRMTEKDHEYILAALDLLKKNFYRLALVTFVLLVDFKSFGAHPLSQFPTFSV